MAYTYCEVKRSLGNSVISIFFTKLISVELEPDPSEELNFKKGFSTIN